MKHDVNFEDVVRIGQYQLENLQMNRVHFLYLDLRTDRSENTGHAYLARSQAVDAGDALAFVLGQNLPKETPIVLICENGSKSLGVALELEANSYINVYVVEGGAAGIDFTQSVLNS